MSYVTDVMMLLYNPSREVRDRFESTVERWENFRPQPDLPDGPNCTGLKVYHFGADYMTQGLHDFLVSGPWPDGSVLFIECEADARPLIKIFGKTPSFGWDSEPEVAR